MPKRDIEFKESEQIVLLNYQQTHVVTFTWSFSQKSTTIFELKHVVIINKLEIYRIVYFLCWTNNELEILYAKM